MRKGLRLSRNSSLVPGPPAAGSTDLRSAQPARFYGLFFEHLPRCRNSSQVAVICRRWDFTA